MYKKGQSVVILILLSALIVALIITAQIYQNNSLDMSPLLLEKQTSDVASSIDIALYGDTAEVLEDAIRFYFYSLDLLNLSGDNNKLKVLEKVKNSTISGLPEDDVDYILKNKNPDQVPPPIIFKKRLADNLIYHLKQIREDFKGLYDFRVCQYFIVPSTLYEDMGYFIFSDNVTKLPLSENPRFRCNDDSRKSTNIENEFCKITLANYLAEGDLDGDGIINKEDSDADGDDIADAVNWWTGKKEGGEDLDSNADGLPDNFDKLIIKGKMDATVFKNKFPSLSVGNKPFVNVTLVLPFTKNCKDAFSFDVEDRRTYQTKVNPFYVFVFPIENKGLNNEIDIPNEFDYQESSFYVYVAPYRVFVKNWIDKNNYNIIDKRILNNYYFFDIGLYRVTSECDGNLTMGC